MELCIATKEEMPAVFALRFEVFVDEQNVPREIELDEEDAHAVHLLAKDGEPVVGCARIIFGDRDAHIGRLAVKRNWRGRGIGAAVCRYAMDVCRERGYSHIWLHAQLHAAGFYEKLGFHPIGDTFFEAGIEHVRMEWICENVDNINVTGSR